MGKETATFRDIEIENLKSHHHSNLILLEDVNIEKNTGVSYGFFRRKKI